VTVVERDDLELYLEHAVRGDHPAAAGIALRLARALPQRVVLDGLVAAAQREAGLRWHRNTYTVADEHLVTTTSTAVIETLSNARTISGSGRYAVVACAEGDWHSLPARLFAEHLRLLGWDVSYLGATVPADHVASFLDRRRPDVLCISAALPLSYRGVAALADVARQRGVLSVAGGLAFGPHVDRARKLGADHGAASADDVHDLVESRGPVAATVAAPLLDAEAMTLDVTADEIADAAMAGLGQLFPALRSLDARQLRRTHEDLAYITRFAAAAVLVDDRTVWTDFVAWQVALLGVRGVPERAFHAGVDAVASQLEFDFPAAARILAGAGAPGAPHRG